MKYIILLLTLNTALAQVAVPNYVTQHNGKAITFRDLYNLIDGKTSSSNGFEFLSDKSKYKDKFKVHDICLKCFFTTRKFDNGVNKSVPAYDHYEDKPSGIYIPGLESSRHKFVKAHPYVDNEGNIKPAKGVGVEIYFTGWKGQKIRVDSAGQWKSSDYLTQDEKANIKKKQAIIDKYINALKGESRYHNSD
jgi:hypothetical protein